MFTEQFFDTMQKSFDWTNKYFASLDRLQNTVAKPGVSPYEEVLVLDDTIRLLKFTTDKQVNHKVPLLINYALVNRYVIADLQQGKSMIERLLQSGIEVYVIDWGYPNPSDRYRDLDEYVNHYMHRAVAHICATHGLDAIDLLGICQGGALALCYTSLHPNTVRRLVTMVTPVDFQTKHDILSHIIREVDVDEFVRAFGNVSGHFLNTNFNLLQPTNLNIKKWLNSVHSLSDEKFSSFFLNMEAWINDSPDQAGLAYKEFIETFYQGNGFVNGTVAFANQTVDTKVITQPLLNVFGAQDHLVPPESSRALKGITSSVKYEEYEVDTGHIGMYVSGKAKAVPNYIADWLMQ